MRRIEQSGGDDAVNLQAGQDVNVYVGVSAAEVRDIALDVFRANFLELRGVAEDVARERAEKITRDFIDALQARNAEGLSSIQDPDMQMTLYNAQKGYACSGDEDLEATLIDLLVDRAGQRNRDLKTLVLNQAIECLPKLTDQQRKALAIRFLVGHTGHNDLPLRLRLFYGIISHHFAPFADISSVRPVDLQYAQAAGVGATSNFVLKVEQALWLTYCGFVFKGFSVEQAKSQLKTFDRDFTEDQINALLGDRSVFIPCIRNVDLLQFNAVSMENVKRLQTAKGLDARPGSAGPFETLCLHGRMSDEEIREDVVSHVSAMSQLFEYWQKSGLEGFQLTAIGVAIGHSCWRQATGSDAPIDIWL